jgi:alpha-galactosidase
VPLACGFRPPLGLPFEGKEVVAPPLPPPSLPIRSSHCNRYTAVSPHPQPHEPQPPNLIVSLRSPPRCNLLKLIVYIAAVTAEHCPLPGTACRPDGPWPQTKCKLLENQTACEAAMGTPQCNLVGCTTSSRCVWSSSCADPPPPPPPQPCTEITQPQDCVWSLGRDCRWADGSCTAPPPPAPLPNCIHDHSCADNGLSTTPPMGWRSWNLFAGTNTDATMRAMMHAFTDKSRSVNGVPTSLSEVGYISVGMDDGYQLCNCSGSHGQEDTFPHSLYNVSCSGGNSGQEANACADGRCTWHNQSDGTPMIDTLKFPDLKGLVAYGHSLALQVGRGTAGMRTSWLHSLFVQVEVPEPLHSPSRTNSLSHTHTPARAHVTPYLALQVVFCLNNFTPPPPPPHPPPPPLSRLDST